VVRGGDRSAFLPCYDRAPFEPCFNTPWLSGFVYNFRAKVVNASLIDSAGHPVSDRFG
jgi:hypothetical protein